MLPKYKNAAADREVALFCGIRCISGTKLSVSAAPWLESQGLLVSEWREEDRPLPKQHRQNFVVFSGRNAEVFEEGKHVLPDRFIVLINQAAV